MPLKPVLIMNDYLDTDVDGIFTTLYTEKNEILLKHNMSQLRVKLVKEEGALAAYLFSTLTGWVEIRREETSDDVTFIPLSLPCKNEESLAAEFDSSIDEYRKYNGMRYLKDIAVLLGSNPTELDGLLYKL